MGKRELVLISVFLVLGICVYQFTAPAPAPGTEVSFGGIVNKLRRNIQGARQTAPADWTQATPVDAGIRELRINIGRPNDLTITGEDRQDIAAELHAVGRGYDEAEAKAVAAAGRLHVERIGDGIVISIEQGTDRATPRNARLEQLRIVLKVPRRLALRLEPHSGELVASNIASADIMGSRGETRVSNVDGLLRLSHSGGRLEIESARSLKLTARNSRGSIKHISGIVSLDATGAELEISDIVGPLDVEMRNDTELTLDAGKALKPPLRVNANGGRLRLAGLHTEARIDGRKTDLEVVMDAAAPVTIYNTGDDINVTAPPAGYTLDAVATEGRLDIADGSLKPQDGDARVNGAVRGGGPTISLRATRGDITLRKPEGK